VASMMTFQFLDVGMGDGTLVQIRPDGQDYDTLVLVDFGEALTQFKVGWKDALTYLTETVAANSKERGLDYPYIDYLFITHPDRDHQNKIRPLCEAVFPGLKKPLRFGRVRYGGTEDEYPDKLIEALEGRCNDVGGMEENWGSPVNDSVVTPYLTFGSGKDPIRAYVLSVNYPMMEAEPNPKSIVLMFELDGRRVILPGDAEAPTEGAILERYAKVPEFLRAFGLKLGHHGSRAATSNGWVKAVQPRAIFASADFVWRHPYCEAICRVLARGELAETNPAWYVCGNDDTYYNNRIERAVCMNLWYWCLDDQPMILYPDKKRIQARRGWTWGVQWELTLASESAWNIAQTYTAIPDGTDHVGPSWKCSSTLEAEAVPDPSPEAFAPRFSLSSAD
jgi:competence protein ComEC